jgi:N-acetylneuraminate lyase
MTSFSGVVPATITPFDLAGRFNEHSFRVIMESNIGAGVDGFWVSGGTGESVLLTENEIIKMAEISAEMCKGRAAAMIHIGSLTTDSSARMAKAAADAGAAAICCVPPFFYKPSEKAIIDHYRIVADAAGDLPFFVYNQPKYTGVEFDARMLGRIKEAVPQIAGVKHSAPDFSDIRRFSELGIDTFTGHGSLFLPTLAAGGAGVVDGPLIAFPEIWVGIYEAYKSGDMARAQELQGKGNILVDLAAKYGMQSFCKVLCEERYGVECGNPRMPIPSLTVESKKHLIGEVKSYGFTVS